MSYTVFTCVGMNNSNPSATQAERNTVSREAFDREKNAKNEAYAFILSHHLLDEFREFCRATKGNDMHELCLQLLVSKL